MRRLEIKNSLLFAVLVLSFCCKSYENKSPGEICYAVERNEIFVEGRLYLNGENEMLLEFKYGVDSILTTGHLIGCSERVDESILKFYNQEKSYSDDGKVNVGVWGIILESPRTKRYDIIIEQLVGL